MIAAIGKEAEQTKQFIRETCRLEVHQDLKDTWLKRRESKKTWQYERASWKRKQEKAGKGRCWFAKKVTQRKYVTASYLGTCFTKASGYTSNGMMVLLQCTLMGCGSGDSAGGT